jgi:hypothetical protein
VYQRRHNPLKPNCHYIHNLLQYTATWVWVYRWVLELLERETDRHREKERDTHTRTHAHTHKYIYSLSLSSVHSHVFISCCSVAASNGGRSPSSGFLNYSRPQLPDSNSSGSQQLNPSSPQTNLLTCPAYNTLAWITQKPLFFCCCFQLLPCKHACLWSHYLVNGCCIAASSMVVA